MLRKMIVGLATLSGVLLVACQPIQAPAPGAESNTLPAAPTEPAANPSSEGATAMNETELVGPVWQWQRTQMSDDTVTTAPDPARYTLNFLPDSQVQVQSDCNRGSGAYKLAENQLTFGPIATTLMACLPDSLDSVFNQQLSEVSGYLMDGGNLVLTLQADSGSMFFAPATAAATAETAATATLTGTVAYRERIALLPGAVIEVQLQDVSKADAPATVIASQTITTAGENVPIPFTLTYDPAQIDERYTYALNVRISIQGQLRWINTDRYAVLTQDASTSGVDVLVRGAR